MKRAAPAVVIAIAVVVGLFSSSGTLLADQPNNAGAVIKGLVPRDATALCVDGSWSSAENRRGTCSSHGGLQKWFGKPPKGATVRCHDGTYSKSKEPQGACSKHGGVAYKFER
mgnify:CR=1 FL=1